MNLTIDRGNSSAKLTLWDDGRAAYAVTVADLTADGLCRFAGGKRFDGVILSAVAPVAAEAEEAARTLGRRYVRLSADTPTPLDFSRYDIFAPRSRPHRGRCRSALGCRPRAAACRRPRNGFDIRLRRRRQLFPRRGHIGGGRNASRRSPRPYVAAPRHNGRSHRAA